MKSKTEKKENSEWILYLQLRYPSSHTGTDYSGCDVTHWEWGKARWGNGPPRSVTELGQPPTLVKGGSESLGDLAGETTLFSLIFATQEAGDLLESSYHQGFGLEAQSYEVSQQPLGQAQETEGFLHSLAPGILVRQEFLCSALEGAEAREPSSVILWPHYHGQLTS